MAIDFKLLNALTKARRVYGDNYLIDLAIEEMGELIVALNHHRRKRVEASAVQEEIADVMLALKELQQIFGTGDIVDFYRKKCERFEQRVEEKEAETKPQPQYQIGDIVSHRNDPNIRFIVQTIFIDGTYRILPLNADMGRAITAATDDCMSLIKRKGD